MTQFYSGMKGPVAIDMLNQLWDSAGDIVVNTELAAQLAASASSSALSASLSATAASNSATAALVSASAASSSALDLEAQALLLANLLATFEDKYLGPKSTPPNLDNAGEAISVGAIYFNTSDNSTYIRSLVDTWIPSSNLSTSVLASLLAAEAESSLVLAMSYKNLAKDWAEKSTEVELGKYSSKYWALQAHIAADRQYNLVPTLMYSYTGILDNPPSCLGLLFNGTILSTGIVPHNLIFIGNTRLASILFTNLEGLVGGSGNFNILKMHTLTDLSFPVLKYVHGLSTSSVFILEMLSLILINLPNLVVFGLGFQVFNLPSLTQLNLPSLVQVGLFFNIQSLQNLTIVNVPQLEVVGLQCSIQSNNSLQLVSVPYLNTVGTNLYIYNCPVLNSIQLPTLTLVGLNVTLESIGNITSFNLPSITTIGGSLVITNIPTLTSILLSLLVSIGHTVSSGWIIDITTGNDLLTEFNLPSSIKAVGANGNAGVRITLALLSQASVDNILSSLASLDGSNGTSTFLSRIVTITGMLLPPSATGLAAKSILQARGCTVTHN